MDFSKLPPELFQKILKYLSPQDLVQCQSVNIQWRNVGRHVEELKWKAKCMKDFKDTFEDAKRKSQLSWKELYNSLNIWWQIKNSDIIDVYESEYLDVSSIFRWSDRKRRFYMLENGIISYPTSTGDEYSRPGYFDSIFYYSSDCLSKVNQVDFDFMFSDYAENDKLIVLQDRDENLRILDKRTDLLYTVGKIQQYEYGDYSVVMLLRDRVYFKTADNMLWVSKVTDNNNKKEITTEKMDFIKDHDMRIFSHVHVAIAQVKENQVNILTLRGYIYAIIDKKVEYICQIWKGDNRDKVLKQLKDNGFDWSSREVYEWLGLRDFVEGDHVEVTKLKNATVFSYGRFIVIGTSRRVLHFYVNPFKPNGNLNLYNKRPNFKIDLNEYYPLSRNDMYRSIEQIDVVEIKDGHRVVALYGSRLIIIEMSYKR